MNKKYILKFILLSLFSFLIAYITSLGRMMVWVNHLFILGICMLIIAAIYYILQQDLFFTFKKGVKVLFKKNELNVQDDFLELDRTELSWSRWMSLILFIGALNTVTSILAAFCIG